MSDDQQGFSPESPESDNNSPFDSAIPWKVLIVDDDEAIRLGTIYALRFLTFRGRPMQLITADSAAAAREIFCQQQDIALAFVDIVMETDRSGLDLVRFVRDELCNHTVSIVLRTGQPGYAPEREVIVDYEINDYKLKTDLSATKLVTAVISGLRAYSNNVALTNLTRQLEAQLVQSEKMATLGLMVANVAHEINTPIGSIQSSGAAIVTSLDEALSLLPRLYQVLDLEHQVLFMKLFERANQTMAAISTREVRAITAEVAQKLEQSGIANARHKAGLLVKLNAQSVLEDYLPLLRHQHSDLILDTATNLVAIIKSTHNINTAVERVAKIVLALKSFSRVSQSADMIEADLKDGIETVLTIYHHQIKHGIEVVRQYDEIPPLKCLPDELSQVWTNLIHNALQAMDHKGTLTIGVRHDGEEAIVSIGDSGSGIPEEIRSKIFDVFFTTKPAGVGSGLGLDIVRKIVEKHKGRIEVQSEVGVGTTFSVFLPYEAAEP